MKIIIHRGADQIGGAITEIKSKEARIFIDFGYPLEEENKNHIPEIKGLTSDIPDCDGVFFTHFHHDHTGMLEHINSDIPLYSGALCKELMLIMNQRKPVFQQGRLEKIYTFSAGKAVTIKDMQITPYCVDHSAPDSYIFLIESGGKKILHTGDFRTHGFRGKGLAYVLQNYVCSVDCLISEGTTLNRPHTKPLSEYELTKKASSVFQNNKYVFVLCSSSNLDRIAGLSSVVPKGKYCICDDYQNLLIEMVKKHYSPKSSLYSFGKMLTYGQNLTEKMNQRGFVMFVRANNKFKEIITSFKHKNPLILYSMWEGYLEKEEIKAFINDFNIQILHTSGHADYDALKLLVEAISPKVIIPIHTTSPYKFPGENIVLLKDKEEYRL